MLRFRHSQSGLHGNGCRQQAAAGRSHLRRAFTTGALAVSIAFLALLFCSQAWAQEVTGSIVGTVVDPSGAALTGAAVTARDVNRGTVRTTTTDDTGSFRIERVPVGRYEVKVDEKGFQTAVNPAFDLVLNQIARLNFEMKIGQASETVEVNAAPPLLQTDSTEISTHIDSVATENLPLITRNYNQLTLLTPGAVSTNPGASSVS